MLAIENAIDLTFTKIGGTPQVVIPVIVGILLISILNYLLRPTAVGNGQFEQVLGHMQLLIFMCYFIFGAIIFLKTRIFLETSRPFLSISSDWAFMLCGPTPKFYDFRLLYRL